MRPYAVGAPLNATQRRNVTAQTSELKCLASTAIEGIKNFTVEAPFATGGCLLAFCALISSMFKNNLNLIHLFGFPAAGLLICQIFYPYNKNPGSNSEDNVSLQQKAA